MSTHWPEHFYLIGAAAPAQPLQPSQEPIGSETVNSGTVSSKTMGSKAYNLLRMATIGLPVPPALVIGTHYTQIAKESLAPTFEFGLPALEGATGQVFGDSRRPLIVSVRSGAPVSMPGMMETLLNIGLCEQTLPGLLRQTGNPRLVWDSYRRLIASYGETVAGLPGALFEAELGQVAQGRDERLLDFAELRALSRRFLLVYEQAAGAAFPQNVQAQLAGAIGAVFASWNAEKSREYRRLNHIDEAIGTAVTIQAMVFGNSGGHAGAGVGFTRDPTNGEQHLWVDFLANAQGEDVVSGRRNAHGHEVLARIAPVAWQSLEASAQAIEREFADMQDFEFTVQDGHLHMLQTRSGKRTPLAAARIALDLFDAGIIDAATALARTEHLQEADLGTLQLAAAIDAVTDATVLANAMSACPGVVSGEIALDAERAKARATAGVAIVLVRQDAETNDIAALHVSQGLLTQRGARTSHAAVVARQLGKVCLVGCQDLRIDSAARTIRFGERQFSEGDVITLDGNAGAIHAGALAVVKVVDELLLERLRALRKANHPRKHGT